MEEVATILERPAGCAVGIVRGERTLTVTLPSRPT
jgi:hypothetical protein